MLINIQLILNNQELSCKMSLLSLFHRNPKQVEESVPTFNITEPKDQEIDYEVSEISFEEYQSAITEERRLSVRHAPVNK